MLKINDTNVRVNDHEFDYELENGTLLHESEWNGEVYTVKENSREVTYRPVYDENENDNGGYDIIGFDYY